MKRKSKQKEDTMVIENETDPRVYATMIGHPLTPRQQKFRDWHQTENAALIGIEGRDGIVSVVDANRGKVIGHLTPAGEPIDTTPRPWSHEACAVIGFFSGFLFASLIALISCRYFIPLH